MTLVQSVNLIRSDTNRAVNPQNMSRCLKFWIYEEEVLYYSCSGYPEADLCLCYRVCKEPVSHAAAHMGH